MSQQLGSPRYIKVDYYILLHVSLCTASDPGCYQLTKKPTLITGNPTFTTDRDPSASVFTRFNVSSNNTPENT